MITETSGNLLNAEADVLVNTVNCVGAMGKGIAADFKKRYPDMYVDYVRRCDERAVRPGRPYAWLGDGKTVINFPNEAALARLQSPRVDHGRAATAG